MNTSNITEDLFLIKKHITKEKRFLAANSNWSKSQWVTNTMWQHFQFAYHLKLYSWRVSDLFNSLTLTYYCRSDPGQNVYKYSENSTLSAWHCYVIVRRKIENQTFSSINLLKPPWSHLTLTLWIFHFFPLFGKEKRTGTKNILPNNIWPLT